MPWAALWPPHHLPGLPGLSRRPTCGPALARNTCAQQLPRTEELFETPYPVWELFQMKSVTLHCIKTFFFLKEKSRKRESSKESPLTAVASPCPATVTPHPCGRPSPLPTASVGRWATVPLPSRPEESVQLHAASSFSVLAPAPVFPSFLHSTDACCGHYVPTLLGPGTISSLALP